MTHECIPDLSALEISQLDQHWALASFALDNLVTALIEHRKICRVNAVPWCLGAVVGETINNSEWNQLAVLLDTAIDRLASKEMNK